MAGQPTMYLLEVQHNELSFASNSYQLDIIKALNAKVCMKIMEPRSFRINFTSYFVLEINFRIH